MEVGYLFKKRVFYYFTLQITEFQRIIEKLSIQNMSFLTSNFKTFEEISIVCEDLQLYKSPAIIQMNANVLNIKYNQEKFLKEMKQDCWRLFLLSDQKIGDLLKDLIDPMATMNNLARYLFPGIKQIEMKREIKQIYFEDQEDKIIQLEILGLTTIFDDRLMIDSKS